MTDPPKFLQPNWHYKSLRYGGFCRVCGRKVAQREMGWHDPKISKILCADCGKQLAEQSGQAPKSTGSSPIGGSSTLRWAKRGNTRNRRKGAAGEYVMDLRLHRDLTNGEVILNDRRVPGGGGNIDHIVVAQSGVWIIDTKFWDGKIDYRGASGIFDPNERLFFKGKDCTYLADNIYAQVIPIAEVLNDRSIPIRPALVFVNADWASTFRIIRNKPYRHNHVTISWPKALISEIKKSGPLSTKAITTVGERLDEQLTPM